MKKLIQKCKAIKEEYLSRSPRGKWTFVLKIGIFILKICGVEAIDINYKVTWYSFACAVVILDLFLSFIYTVWCYWGRIEGCLAIPIFDIVFSVSFGLQIYAAENATSKVNHAKLISDRQSLCIFRHCVHHLENRCKVLFISAVKRFTQT